jgi:hypothetical protein
MLVQILSALGTNQRDVPEKPEPRKKPEPVHQRKRRRIHYGRPSAAP